MPLPFASAAADAAVFSPGFCCWFFFFLSLAFSALPGMLIRQLRPATLLTASCSWTQAEATCTAATQVLDRAVKRTPQLDVFSALIIVLAFDITPFRHAIDTPFQPPIRHIGRYFHWASIATFITPLPFFITFIFAITPDIATLLADASC